MLQNFNPRYLKTDTCVIGPLYFQTSQLPLDGREHVVAGNSLTMRGSVESFTMKAASLGSSVTREFATTTFAPSSTDAIFVKPGSTSAMLEVLGIGTLLAVVVDSVDVLGVGMVGTLLAVVLDSIDVLPVSTLLAVVPIFSVPRRFLSTISSGDVAVWIVIYVAS